MLLYAGQVQAQSSKMNINKTLPQKVEIFTFDRLLYRLAFLNIPSNSVRGWRGRGC